MNNKSVQNILYIVPSRDWSTRERIAYRDIIIARKEGHKVFICTYEDSPLAKLSRTLSSEIIPFKEHFLNKMTSFYKHFPLKSIFKKVKFDIIHCYELNLLLSLSLQLKTESVVALIITQDHLIDRPLQRFWYKPLISRIDILIMINKNLKQDIRGNLDIPLKKIEYFGMGLYQEPSIEEEQIPVDFSLYRDYFLAGTYISPECADIANITPLLSALKVLNEKNSCGKKNKLVFLSVVDFQSIAVLPEIMRLVQELQLEEDVLFATTQDVKNVVSYFNLWISNRADELMEDFAICAILNEVPALFPRNFCTKDFLEEYVGVGETYKLYDARELRDKWERILLGNALFKEKTRLYKYFIEREQSYKTYRMKLLSIYSSSLLRKERLFNRK